MVFEVVEMEKRGVELSFVKYSHKMYPRREKSIVNTCLVNLLNHTEFEGT